MRILHAPTNIANQGWAVVQGLRERGHHAEVWHYLPNPFAFRADRLIERGGDPAVYVRTFIEALAADFEVFHFHFGRSLIYPYKGLPWFWDLPVLRALGKRVLFTFHGTDVRLRSKHIAEDPWSFYRFADVPCDEERIDRSLRVIRTFAHRMIVANPLNRTFVPDAVYVPKAIHLPDYPVVGPRRTSQPLVVHVPSRRTTKGTEFVLKGVASLRDRGVSFDFEIAEALTNDQLRALYAEADVVVDNLLLGDCEVSALEAMALGKPVVTRVRSEALEFYPELPIVNADPDNFVDQLETVVRSARERAQLGERARSYVERHHASEVVAEKLEALYRQTPKPVYAPFPEWVAIPRPDRESTYQKQIQQLEIRISELKLDLRTKNQVAKRLQRRLQEIQKSPVYRAWSTVKRLRSRLIDRSRRSG